MAAVVRPMEARDVAPVSALLLAYAKEFDALIDTDVRREAEDPAAAYAAPDARMLVAEDGGAVLGCVAWKRVEGSCEMKRLVVDPARRGQGLGRSLATAVMTDAARAGFTAMFLVTSQEMQAARALYADLGFKPSAPYRPTRTTCALTMDRLLAPPRA